MKVSMAVEVGGSGIGPEEGRRIIAEAKISGRLYGRELDKIVSRPEGRDGSTLRWDLRSLGELSIYDEHPQGCWVEVGAGEVYISGAWNQAPYRGWSQGITLRGKTGGASVLLEVDVPFLEGDLRTFGPDDFLVVWGSAVKELSHRAMGCESEIETAERELARLSPEGDEPTRRVELVKLYTEIKERNLHEKEVLLAEICRRKTLGSRSA